MKKEKKQFYQIVLFCNKKRIKLLYRCRKRTTVTEKWHEFKTERKPPYVQQIGLKRNLHLNYELALIYPNNRWLTKVYVKDSLGRNIEAKINNNKYAIKEIIPYWKEELIYDYESKKRIRYHIMMEYINNIKEIAQIFTLNNKLFVQIDNNVRLYGNKNISDTERLYEIVRNDLLSKNKTNFIFSKDINRQQRSQLYELLEQKGYKRTELFRHYSY